MKKRHHRKKYPRHCCARCDVMHHSYAAAEAHKKSMGHGSRRAHHRRKATGFAAMSMKKRRAIARKGGRASARARGYR